MLKTNLVASLLLFSLSSIALAAELSCSKSDAAHLDDDITSYVTKNTEIPANNIEIKSLKCMDQYASALVHPVEPTTDEAKVYLRKDNHDWRVIAFGTDVEDAKLAAFPKELR